MNVTIMQSTLLSNATARDDIKAIKAKNMGKIGFMGPTIPRTNVAGFLLNEAENQTYAGQVVCLIVWIIWKVGIEAKPRWSAISPESMLETIELCLQPYYTQDHVDVIEANRNKTK